MAFGSVVIWDWTLSEARDLARPYPTLPNLFRRRLGNYLPLEIQDNTKQLPNLTNLTNLFPIFTYW